MTSSTVKAHFRRAMRRIHQVTRLLLLPTHDWCCFSSLSDERKLWSLGADLMHIYIIHIYAPGFGDATWFSGSKLNAPKTDATFGLETISLIIAMSIPIAQPHCRGYFGHYCFHGRLRFVPRCRSPNGGVPRRGRFLGSPRPVCGCPPDRGLREVGFLVPRIPLKTKREEPRYVHAIIYHSVERPVCVICTIKSIYPVPLGRL